MPSEQKSYQQLDPVGGWGAHPITIAGAGGLVGYAVIATLATWGQVDHPLAALGSVASVVGGAAVLAYWSSPQRAPFPTAAFLAALGFGTLSMVLATVASWQGNTGVRDDWAPLAFGMLLLLLGWYRPPRQLALSAILVGIAAGFIALLQSRSGAGDSGEPVIAVIITAGTPPLAIALAGACYAAVRAGLVRNWRSDRRTATDAMGHHLREGILRSVREDRVTILNRDVVPFLSGLLEVGRIGAAEKETAARIAESIRSLMVAEVDRSWLDVVVERVGNSRFGQAWGDRSPVLDIDRVAPSMSIDQRTITRALIVALFEYEGFDPDAFRVILTRNKSTCQVELTARVESEEALQRSDFTMYIAVMRVVFTRLRLASDPPVVTLKFSYEQ